VSLFPKFEIKSEGVAKPAKVAKTDQKINKISSFSNFSNGSNVSEILGIPFAELQQEAGEDWPEVRDNPKLLQAFAHATKARRMREEGVRPPEYTQPATCPHCGPVWLWAGAPEQVLGCPWCFNRIKGLPMPQSPTTSLNKRNSVTCDYCQHFRRTDRPHLGHCAKGEPEPIAGLWDSDRRYCERFLPRLKRTNNGHLRPIEAKP
jgi:hypothetical protein